MPTLTITVDNAQAARVANAFGPLVPREMGEPLRPATLDEVRDILISHIRGVVRHHELHEARAAADAGVTDVTPT